MGRQAILAASKAKLCIAIVGIGGLLLLCNSRRYSADHEDRHTNTPESQHYLPRKRTSITHNRLHTTISAVQSNTTALRDCIVNTKQDLWQNLVAIVEQCVKHHTRLTERTFQYFQVGRYGEKKVFLPLISTAAKACVFLTVGIGGDIMAELEFRKRYHSCKLFGMDPKEDQGKLFNRVGTFIRAGLSIEGGELNMTVRKPDGTYKQEMVPTITLNMLAENHLHTNVVHFLTLDIEGFEYKILPQFQKGGVAYLADVTVCQMDLELHGPTQDFFDEKDNGFDAFFRNFVKQSKFLPIYAVKHIGDNHKKVTVLNYVDTVCGNSLDWMRYF